MAKRVLLTLRNEPDQQLFLFLDGTDLLLRNIWFTAASEPKSRTLPLRLIDLQTLATYVSTKEFADMVMDIEAEGNRG